jgi:hypothetical protein
MRLGVLMNVSSRFMVGLFSIEIGSLRGFFICLGANNLAIPVKAIFLVTY